jgi:hypothetical protein
MAAGMTELVRADLLASLESSGWISSTALVIDRTDLPYEKFEALGGLIGTVGSAAKWWTGDFLMYAEHLYGELAAQASESLNLSEAGRQDCVRVALAIPRSKRRPGLSWWIHRQVAAKWITPSMRDDLLDRAEREKLTTRQLEAVVKDLRALHSDSRGATDECEHVVNDAARDLRTALLGCGYPDDIAVVVTISAPGVALEVRLP